MRCSAKAGNLKGNLWGCGLNSHATATVFAILLFASVQPTQAQGSAAQPARPDATQVNEVQAARERVQASPQDAKARFELGRALRLAGKPEQAASEYLEATSLDPSFYLAYHELSLIKCRPEQIDEAADRLNGLKEQKPKDLMLRVALSELLEQKGQNYAAARVLVDMVYQNAVPEKYLKKVNSRIHFLLSKTKDVQTAQKVQSEDEDMDSVPPPLPETTLHRNLAASKVKDPKSMQGFGHTTLLP